MLVAVGVADHMSDRETQETGYDLAICSFSQVLRNMNLPIIMIIIIIT